MTNQGPVRRAVKQAVTARIKAKCVADANLLQAVLDGVAFTRTLVAEATARLVVLLCGILGAAADVTAICGLTNKSVEATVAAVDGWTVDAVMEIIVATWVEVDTKVAQLRACDAARERDRETPMASGGLDGLPPAVPLGEISMDTIFARIEEASRDAGVRMSVADYFSSFLVHDPHSAVTYMRNVDRGGFRSFASHRAQLSLSQLMPRLPPGLMTMAAPEELMRLYSVIPTATQAEGGAIVRATYVQRDYFRPGEGSQLVLAHSPLRDLGPEYSPEFNGYLDAAFGAKKTLFVDHLIASLDLSRVSAAVQLVGERQRGKSLLITVLSRLYGTSGPTSLTSYLDHYSDWQNPIVAQDDAPAKASTGRPPDGATIRAITTAYERPLNVKHQRPVKVLGAIRLINAENGQRMNDFSGQSPAEQRATAERIAVFHLRPEAAEYLHRLGADYVARAINEDIFTRHIVWLAANCAISRRGSRLLVEGDQEESLIMLQRSDSSENRILHAIVRQIVDPPARHGAPPAVLVGDGDVGVNADKLLSVWAETMPHERQTPPRLDVAKQTIRRYAVDENSTSVKVAGKTHRYWRINVERVLAYADEVGDWDVPSMRAAIDRPRLRSVPAGAEPVPSTASTAENAAESAR